MAALFILLRSPFLAAAQLFIYVGAVMVLFLFVVMVLDLGRASFDEPVFHRRIWGIVVVLGLFAEVVYLTLKGEPSHIKGPYVDGAMMNNTEVMGTLLYTKYIYPFEIVSILLLLALVGAIALTMNSKGE